MSRSAFLLRRSSEDRKERPTMTASRTAGHRPARVHHLGVRDSGDALGGVRDAGDALGDAGDAGDSQNVAHPTYRRRTS
jgi:hypothetical protein